MYNHFHEPQELKTFEITRANVECICDTFVEEKLPQLGRIFREALAQMEFDSEMLWDFYGFYCDHLNGENGYGFVQLSCSQFPHNDLRRISKLVNYNHNLVDCHMLSMLAIDICLDTYNHLRECPGENNADWILDNMCEASEAVAFKIIVPLIFSPPFG